MPSGRATAWSGNGCDENGYWIVENASGNAIWQLVVALLVWKFRLGALVVKNGSTKWYLDVKSESSSGKVILWVKVAEVLNSNNKVIVIENGCTNGTWMWREGKMRKERRKWRLKRSKCLRPNCRWKGGKRRKGNRWLKRRKCLWPNCRCCAEKGWRGIMVDRGMSTASNVTE